MHMFIDIYIYTKSKLYVQRPNYFVFARQCKSVSNIFPTILLSSPLKSTSLLNHFS